MVLQLNITDIVRNLSTLIHWSRKPLKRFEGTKPPDTQLKLGVSDSGLSVSPAKAAGAAILWADGPIDEEGFSNDLISRKIAPGARI